jgi:hypothetical protein
MHPNTHKYKITEAVRKQLPSDDTPIEIIIKDWWFTKSSENLRLTAYGDQALRHAEIEYFDVPINITQDRWYAFIVDCGKKLKCPFYIGTNKKHSRLDGTTGGPFIRLYDSKIAMMLTLYGDIYGYLDSIKVRK